jgi:hypothetical protein
MSDSTLKKLNFCRAKIKALRRKNSESINSLFEIEYINLSDFLKFLQR